VFLLFLGPGVFPLLLILARTSFLEIAWHAFQSFPLSRGSGRSAASPFPLGSYCRFRVSLSLFFSG